MPAAKHNVRQAAEARAWRLALLLTGDEDLAAEVAIQVRRAQPKLESLDPRRLDRLVVMRSREVVQMAARRRRASNAPIAAVPSAAAHADPGAGGLLQALATMEEQPREAWIFARLDGLDEIEVARSMDCSRTATARFLTETDAAMVQSLTEAGQAGPEHIGRQIEALRGWLDSLPWHEAIEARRAIHRRRRRMWIGAWIAIGAAAIAAAMLIIAGF